jgi:hypothetical protein
VKKKPLEWKDIKTDKESLKKLEEERVRKYRGTLERKIWGWIILGAGVYFLIDSIRGQGISLDVVGSISLCYFVMWLGWWLAHPKPKPKSFVCPICGFTEEEETGKKEE